MPRKDLASGILNHFKKELLILKQNYLTILLCIFFNYVHAVAHNLAYYLHVPSEPLFDIGFALLPGLNKQLQILSEIAFFCIVITGVCFMFLPLYAQNVKLFAQALEHVDIESLDELYVASKTSTTNVLTMISRTFDLGSKSPSSTYSGPYPPPALPPTHYSAINSINQDFCSDLDLDLTTDEFDHNNAVAVPHIHQDINTIHSGNKRLNDPIASSAAAVAAAAAGTVSQGSIYSHKKTTQFLTVKAPIDGNDMNDIPPNPHDKFENLWPGQVTVAFNSEHTGTHPPMYGFQILTRFLSVLCLSQSLRTVCFLITGLPGPNYHCRPFSQFYNPPKNLEEILGRSDAFFSCGDLVFSSHTTFILLCALLYTKYGQSTRNKTLFWGLVCIFCGLVIAARKHYTLDIFIACYTVPLLWHVFDMYCPDEILVELAKIELKHAEEIYYEGY